MSSTCKINPLPFSSSPPLCPQPARALFSSRPLSASAAEWRNGFSFYHREHYPDYVVRYIIAIRSLTDSRYNAMSNDVVSAMKPKTFFHHFATFASPPLPPSCPCTRQFAIRRLSRCSPVCLRGFSFFSRSHIIKRYMCTMYAPRINSEIIYERARVYARARARARGFSHFALPARALAIF